MHNYEDGGEVGIWARGRLGAGNRYPEGILHRCGGKNLAAFETFRLLDDPSVKVARTESDV